MTKGDLVSQAEREVFRARIQDVSPLHFLERTGRRQGVSCGRPITHRGMVQSVDLLTGVIVWCVTGPPHPR